MDAVKFLEELRRMCINNKGCNDCPAYAESACLCKLEHIPENYEGFAFDDLVSFVEKWSAEHPVKTRLQDFLEKYPNAPTSKDIPIVSPSYLGYCQIASCANCKHQRETSAFCWNLPLEE